MLFAPFLFLLLIALVPHGFVRNIRIVTLGISGGLLTLSLWHQGHDHLSHTLTVLTSALTFLAVLVTSEKLDNIKLYLISLIFLEGILWILFSTQNLLVFYLAFEGLLFPLFFLICGWGGESRLRAALKLFLYTVFGSVFMLFALVWIYLKTGSLEMDVAFETLKTAPLFQRKLLWCAFFLPFAIKLPVVPFHTWLPEAHVQASTTTSMLLAGIVLKAGGYGFLRILTPYFPAETLHFAPLLWVLGLGSMVFASLVAFAQDDIKKTVAYASVAHMSYVLLGVSAGNRLGAEGALMHMVSHGIISAGLFFAVGVIYERFHTRNLRELLALKHSIPGLNLVFLVLCLGNIGLPGTSGFVGEILVTLSLPFKVAAGLSLGLVLSATYMLCLYRRVFLGPPVKGHKVYRLRFEEISAGFIFALLILGIGLCPTFIEEKQGITTLSSAIFFKNLPE